LPLLKHTERRRSPCPPLPASGASTPPVPASCCVLLARPTVWLLCFARVLVRSSVAGDHSSPRAAMDASQAEARAVAARARGLAAAPYHGASGAQPRARCGHPVSRGSSSPPVAPHSIAAVSLRVAEPHAHVASPPHYPPGRAEGTISGAHRTVLAPRHSSPSTTASPAGFGEVQCLLCS